MITPKTLILVRHRNKLTQCKRGGQVRIRISEHVLILRCTDIACLIVLHFRFKRQVAREQI